MTSHPERMDMSVLRDYPAYAEFRKRTKTKTATGSTGPLEDAEVAASPEDLLGAAVAENRSAGPARSVPLPALVNGDFSFAALRQAAQRGRLDAVHGADGIWRITRRRLPVHQGKAASMTEGLPCDCRKATAGTHQRSTRRMTNVDREPREVAGSRRVWGLADWAWPRW